ncbi:LytR family transcriptional attenuator [Murinocardiopsis flavida]|uniref:LytR family transcriptional attenuator n=1 Tax=Murinocardiopsis flavida TaxID=645275 RepID=A0A2P8DIG7_9ACTN|nr:LytR family transcriptional attenuator [Murinocardiopsis flavida]
MFRRDPGGGLPEPDKLDSLYRPREGESRSGGRSESATRRMPAADEAGESRSGGGRRDSGGRSPGREYGGGKGSSQRRLRERRKRRRRIFAVVLVVLLLVPVVFYFWADSRLNRVAALPDYEGRPDDQPGSTYLIVGSDSREGLTDGDMDNLRTGKAEGKRTDTIMVLYVPDDGGRPSIISVPRDSYVNIPEIGENKINAAFSSELGGGPSTLVQAFEQKSGVRIDHYIEVGFSGFVGIVDAVGGVELCPKEDMKDPKAGLDIKAGCQDMDGPTALGYVRTREGGRSDLDRIKRQREFFGALVEQSTAAGTLANPFRSVPLVINGTDTFTVDEGDHLTDLAGMALAMRENPQTTGIPIGSLPNVGGSIGDVVVWDETRSGQMFDAMKQGKAIPKSAMQD